MKTIDVRSEWARIPKPGGKVVSVEVIGAVRKSGRIM